MAARATADPAAAAPMNTEFTGKAAATTAARSRHPGNRARNQALILVNRARLGGLFIRHSPTPVLQHAKHGPVSAHWLSGWRDIFPDRLRKGASVFPHRPSTACIFRRILPGCPKKQLRHLRDTNRG